MLSFNAVELALAEKFENKSQEIPSYLYRSGCGEKRDLSLMDLTAADFTVEILATFYIIQFVKLHSTSDEAHHSFEGLLHVSDIDSLAGGTCNGK